MGLDGPARHRQAGDAYLLLLVFIYFFLLSPQKDVGSETVLFFFCCSVGLEIFGGGRGNEVSWLQKMRHEHFRRMKRKVRDVLLNGNSPVMCWLIDEEIRVGLKR